MEVSSGLLVQTICDVNDDALVFPCSVSMQIMTHSHQSINQSLNTVVSNFLSHRFHILITVHVHWTIDFLKCVGPHYCSCSFSRMTETSWMQLGYACKRWIICWGPWGRQQQLDMWFARADKAWKQPTSQKESIINQSSVFNWFACNEYYWWHARFQPVSQNYENLVFLTWCI